MPSLSDPAPDSPLSPFVFLSVSLAPPAEAGGAALVTRRVLGVLCPQASGEAVCVSNCSFSLATLWFLSFRPRSVSLSHTGSVGHLFPCPGSTHGKGSFRKFKEDEIKDKFILMQKKG